MTPRALVYATLEFRNKDGRVPRTLSITPWATHYHPDTVARIEREFPSDTVWPPNILKKPTVARTFPGGSIDIWGCRFETLEIGAFGEVKDPQIKDDDWEDAEKVHVPVELLDFDVDQVNAFCRNTDNFVHAQSVLHPFEQLQYLRTTENLFMDLVDPPANMLRFIEKMHTFYCDWLEKWVKTEVDGIYIGDDWGTQGGMLVNPAIWDEMFRPLYKDYIEIAKKHNKKVFFHSCGNTLELFPRWIELGVDAVNAQIFCIGLDKLEPYKGKITLWGELDRQHLIPEGTIQEVQDAVKQVYEKFWMDGGCIAQIEFGGAAKPENVYTVYKTWDDIRKNKV